MRVVDHDPAQVVEWLPAPAHEFGARPPMPVPRFVARRFAGAAGVMTMTDTRGASTAKAKREPAGRPAHSRWRLGLEAA